MAVGWGLALEVDVGLVGGCPAVVQSVGLCLGTRGWQGPAGPRCFGPVLQLSHVKGGISSAVIALSSGAPLQNVLRER